MKIFLIAGKSGSGKTEAAKLIKKNLDKTVVTNFSKYIKLFALEMTDWDGSDQNKPRTFLQQMGDRLRKIDKYFLPKRIMEDILIYEQDYDYLVICDVRMLDEINYIKEHNEGVVTIMIEGKSSNKLSLEEQNHCTENEFMNYDYDYVIKNNYDDNFEKDILEIISKEV